MVPQPFKRKELNEFISIMDEYVKTKGDYHVELEKYEYNEHRGADVGLFLLLVIGGIADIFTIVLAIKELTKKKPEFKEIKITVGNKEIAIRGDIEDSELVKLVKEAGKIDG
jgi:hypothetical protein